MSHDEMRSFIKRAESMLCFALTEMQEITLEDLKVLSVQYYTSSSFRLQHV